jgi:hypothetical protein
VSKQLLCRFCKRPLDQHFIQLVGGVPVVHSYRADGRTPRWCGDLAATEQMYEDRRRELIRLRRSLRWRIGFMSRRGYTIAQVYDYLDTWADKVQDEADQLVKSIRELYR